MLATERLIEALEQINHIVPLSRTAGTTNGTGFDASNADGVLFNMVLGDIGASTTLDFKVQESDDNSAWADVAGAAIVQIAATGDNTLAAVDVRWGGRGNHKKFARGVLTVTGSNAAVCAVVAQKYNLATEPATNTPTPIKV